MCQVRCQIICQFTRLSFSIMVNQSQQDIDKFKFFFDTVYQTIAKENQLSVSISYTKWIRAEQCKSDTAIVLGIRSLYQYVVGSHHSFTGADEFCKWHSECGKWQIMFVEALFLFPQSFLFWWAYSSVYSLLYGYKHWVAF